VAAVCRGLTKAGVAPSPKHFPGHGDTHVDSHISLPVIRKDATSLAQTDLVPFRTACSVGAATIMVGHIALPAITGDTTPAPLSRVVIYDMLRESLGYDGVVVTDCLEMGAIAARKGGVPTATVHALQAGADIAMICHTFDRQRDALEAVYGAVRSGTLDRGQIRAGGRRIAALKDSFAGDWARILGMPFDEAGWGRLKAENALLSRNAYASSIALVRNPHNVIPLPKVDNDGRGGSPGIVVVLTPRMKSSELPVGDYAVANEAASSGLHKTAGPPYLSFAAGINKRVNGASLHGVYSPEESVGAEIGDAIDRGAVSSILFVTRNADRSAWQLDRLREVLRRLGKGTEDGRSSSLRKVTVVVLASCGPYDLLREGKGTGLDEVAYLVSFEFTPDALDAAAAVIFGEEEARGRAPVCGGNVFP
jgi:beta-N-acetylhexosaminidase